MKAFVSERDSTTVTSVGNAGFIVRHGTASFAIDPITGGVPGIDETGWFGVPVPPRLDMILITHSHWDHFDATGIAALAQRTSAVVVGPEGVVKRVAGHSHEIRTIAMEPRGNRGPGAVAPAVTSAIDACRITAWRTEHSPDHNSYLVELPGLRLFHDGDNENTRILDRSVLQKLDILMLCPWQGSDWAAFIDAIRPRNWFLIHMTDEELDQHERGDFFPGICKRVPMDPIALRPGKSWRAGT